VVRCWKAAPRGLVIERGRVYKLDELEVDKAGNLQIDIEKDGRFIIIRV
jgi:hypothetical protein